MPHEHLKDHIYYEELYDKFTIEECIEWERDRELESLKDEDESIAKIKKDFFYKCFIPTSMYFLKGERYANKSETINEWMERDRAKDRKVEIAVEPRGIRCIQCSSPKMACISRDLMDNSKGKEEILFMFQCDECQKRRAYWESGREWESRSVLCSKCRSKCKEKSQVREGDLITTTYICSQCENEDVDTFDLSVKEEFIDPSFEMNRKKYCLSREEGAEYMAQRARLDSLKKLTNGWKEEEGNKELYDALAKIKKLTIVELEKLLNPVLEKAGYTKFQLLNPEIGKDVVVPFGAYDGKGERTKMASEYDLKRLLKKILKDTNWRLMSDGVSYRLGFLRGRLRGVEGEENLLKLAENNIAKKHNNNNN